MNLAASLQGLPYLSTNPHMQRQLQRASQILPGIVVTSLVLVIAWQLAKITWLLAPAPVNDDVVVAQGPVNPTRASNGIDAQKIADAHVFGAANEKTDINNAPQTQMTLVLAGVGAAADPTQGFAFIGESAATAKLHHVGDMIAGSAKLHSVYVDRVMLDRGGRLESLLLPRLTASTSPVPAIAPPPPASSRFAENVRRIAETNPSAFNEIVRPQPVFNGSKLQGYRVYPGRNRQQFARLGLRPGDLVTAVSGTPLTDQSSAMQIFNTIATTDRVTLTVEREGQSQQVTVNTAQIDLPDPNAPPSPPATTSPAPVPAPTMPTTQAPNSVPPAPPTPPQRAMPPDGTPGVIAPEVQ